MLLSILWQFCPFLLLLLLFGEWKWILMAKIFSLECSAESMLSVNLHFNTRHGTPSPSFSFMKHKKIEKRNRAYDKRLMQIILSTFTIHNVSCAHVKYIFHSIVLFLSLNAVLCMNAGNADDIYFAEHLPFPLWTHSGAAALFQFSIISLSICSVSSVALWKHLGCCKRISWLRIVLKTSVLCLEFGRSYFVLNSTIFAISVTNDTNGRK